MYTKLPSPLHANLSQGEESDDVIPCLLMGVYGNIKEINVEVFSVACPLKKSRLIQASDG